MFQHSLENRCPAGQTLVTVLHCRGRRPLERRLQALAREGGPGPGAVALGTHVSLHLCRGSPPADAASRSPGEPAPSPEPSSSPRRVTPLLLKASLLTEERYPAILNRSSPELTPAGPILSLETGRTPCRRHLTGYMTGDRDLCPSHPLCITLKSRRNIPRLPQNRNKVHNRCNELELSQNPCPGPWKNVSCETQFWCRKARVPFL